MNKIELRIDYMSLRINKLEQFSDPDDTQNFSFFFINKITLLKYRPGRRFTIQRITRYVSTIFFTFLYLGQ